LKAKNTSDRRRICHKTPRINTEEIKVYNATKHFGTHARAETTQSKGLVPGTGHFTIPTTTLGGIVGVQNTHLTTIVCLGEGVTALFAHTLDLANLPDSLLELFHARTVVLHVVLLDLLDVVVMLGVVHALGVLPGIITHQTDTRQDDGHQVEYGSFEEHGDGTVVLLGESNGGSSETVGREEDQPDDHGAGDSDEGVFGPEVGDESSLAEDRGENGGVECLAPDPVTGSLAIGCGEIPEENELGDDVENQGVEKSVQDPSPKAVFLEEDTLLAQLVELRVAVKQPSGDVLIEYSHGERRQDGEEHVVEG